MKKPFSLFLALRYLKPKRTFVSIITLISIVGVTLGIMVLILVMSVMTGFERELQRKVLGVQPHVVVQGGVLENWQDVAETVAGLEKVVGVAPFVEGPVIIEFNQRRNTPVIRGIDPELETNLTEIGDYIISGELDLNGDNCVVGADFAREMGIAVGDVVTLFSPENVEAVLRQLDALEDSGSADRSKIREVKEMVIPTELTVTGIFQSGRYSYDSQIVLVPLYVGQEIYGLGGDVHGLGVEAEDPFDAEPVKREIMAALGPVVTTLTWVDLNRQLFEAIAMERTVMFFLLMFIVVVAAFGIMNTLITVTVQKTREIGIIKALGARTWQIIGVFLAQGMVVGFFGALTGLGAGMVVIQFRNDLLRFLGRMGIEVFPASVYQFAEIPAEIV
ncbi:MAG: ABC transporter permease, partial [Chthoniobacterales bacterium]